MNKFTLKKNSWVKFEVLLICIALVGFPFMIFCLAAGMKLAEWMFG
jgi:hypothetical protein